MTRSKDLFRKPYMETPEDDYSDMMKYIPDAAQPDYRSKPHSEMIKPYDDRIRDYNEMEHFYPSNFSIIAQPPSAELIVSGEPNPCEALRHIAFGAKQVWYEIPCGGTLSINNSFEGGLPPYIVIASPTPMNGSLSCDEQGNCYYRAPSECCADITDNIYIQDACGRSANIIIIVKAFDYSISNYQTVIIGSDAPVDGDCYYLQTYVPNTIWSIDKGAIDSGGCVSGLSGQCGVATITATFICQDNEIIGTKKVRMPNGVWVLISTCNNCVSPTETCCNETIYTDDLKISGSIRRAGSTSGECSFSGCIPYPTCESWYSVWCYYNATYQWRCA